MFKELVNLAVEFLKAVSGELDPYTSQKGVITTDNSSATLLTPSHIQFAKYGRGPGKLPPIEPLEEWAKSVGAVDPRQMAWGTAIDISKNGTIGYTPNAPNAMDEAITKHEGEFLEKANNMVAITVNGIMRQIQILPESIETFKM